MRINSKESGLKAVRKAWQAAFILPRWQCGTCGRSILPGLRYGSGGNVVGQ